MLNTLGEVKGVVIPVRCYRLRNNNGLIRNITAGGRSQNEFWIRENNIQINYPAIQLQPRQNIWIEATRHTDGPCWNFALNGSLIALTANNFSNYETKYREMINSLIEYETDGQLIQKFTGLKINWDDYVPWASTVSKNDLILAAGLAINLNSVIRDDVRATNFANALLRVIVEQAGFTIVDDPRFQIHMRSDSFYGFDHWGISMPCCLNPNILTWL